jgi:hypothetical protein
MFFWLTDEPRLFCGSDTATEHRGCMRGFLVVDPFNFAPAFAQLRRGKQGKTFGSRPSPVKADSNAAAPFVMAWN